MKKGPRFYSNFHIKAVIGVHLIWLLMVCLLGAWWGRLLQRQAARIAELEGLLGISVDLTQSHWHRTQNMLFWESAAFFGLLIACTGLLFWLYWRDVKRAKGIQAFFASVTHELRTPLTSIRLQAESIADSLAGEFSQGNLVHRLLEDTIRLESQVERTLELARVEGGGPVYTQPLQVKPWLDRFLKTWTADHRDKLDLNLNVEDIWIDADPTALQIIFKNLLENSVRHSKKDKVKVSILSRSSSEGVILLLKDDGQGYSGDGKTLGRLFYKTPSSQGTGVGLYLVRTLMKRMGGRLQFNFNSGFEVSLSFLEGKSNG